MGFLNEVFGQWNYGWHPVDFDADEVDTSELERAITELRGISPSAMIAILGFNFAMGGRPAEM